MATYNTNITWSDATTSDFFAFKGDGILKLDADFGTVSGALRKYDMEKAIQMSIPVATINGLLTPGSEKIDIPYATISTLTTANILDLGQIRFAYSDFVKECADYFGLTITSWNTTSEDGLKMLYTGTVASKIVANTDSAAAVAADKRLMTKSGFKEIITSSNATTAATSNLSVSELTKNFNNAKVSKVFANDTNADRDTKFCANDLIFFNQGVSLTFSVVLEDTPLTSGTTGPMGGPDYVNTLTDLAGGLTNSSLFTTETSTNNGYFTTTTALASSRLSKTYRVPLVLKVV
jgi:hypothetical protein